MAREVEAWIEGDESARDMLSRVVLTQKRPPLLLPPLRGLPLRPGNVVELVGPSPSAKTHILMQAAMDCILPEEWNGVHYGGLGRLVMFIDLDCRFDVSRLSQMLKNRIMGANGSSHNVDQDKNSVTVCNRRAQSRPTTAFDDKLFVACMRRFLYVRCYDSLEFLSVLKTLNYQLQKEREAQGTSVHLLMIDSIGAFHWVDRATTSLHLGDKSRNGLSLQNVFENVVQEIKKLQLLHSMLVIATKATILGVGNRYAANDAKGNRKRPFSQRSTPTSGNVSNDAQQNLYREYMPSAWQSFVTHRILLQAKDDCASVSKPCNQSIFLSEWLFPLLTSVENFMVKDAGVFYDL